MSIGRKPNTENIGLENTKVKLTDRGFVKINGQLQTDDENIYAIGDVAGNPMLAHKASHEGRIAVEAIAGHKVAFEPQAIPAVVFTDPEVAWCGLTEFFRFPRPTLNPGYFLIWEALEWSPDGNQWR